MSKPEMIGRYPVRQLLGRGAHAAVWLAHDAHLDSPVAIKVLERNWAIDHHMRSRFVDEGRFLRRVDSPHVISVFDAGELPDETPYLVMTYADQGTLADRFAVGSFTARQALDLIDQVGAGLQALHQCGVLHRDLKPANVLFRSDPRRPDGSRVLLSDLGLGKSLELVSRLTLITGTPSYVAPEQARGEELDPRADLYSLGIVTYQVLTGRTPFRHATLASAAEAGPPPPMGTPRRPYPSALEAVLARVLAPDRAQRFDDVASFLAELHRAARG